MSIFTQFQQFETGNTDRVFLLFQTHEAPLNLVMKKGGWEIGEENVTTLTNKEGEEEALRNSRRQRSLSGSTRYGLSRVYSGGEDADGNKCAIM